MTRPSVPLAEGYRLPDETGMSCGVVCQAGMSNPIPRAISHNDQAM